MKRLVIIFASVGVLVIGLPVLAAAPTLAQRYAGRFLILADQRGQAWYVHPATRQRYYVRDAEGCFALARDQALGINEADLTRLDRRRDIRLFRRLAGRFLLAVEQRGALWYLNPADGRRYAIPDGPACFALVGRFGRGITTKGLRTIPMNREQLAFDHTFNQVATARLTNGRLEPGPYADRILPIASLTKLMTALVLLELQPDWNRAVTVTAEDLAYPQAYVDPGDITSEVALSVGQTVTMHDLWMAMLLASSNQAAAMLARHSGLPPAIFTGAMNAKARQLGLSRTAFSEPSGLDPANVSTAAEVAQLAAAAFNHPEIALTSVLRHATITAQLADRSMVVIPIINRNASLMNLEVEAAKTGFLDEAQRTVAVRKAEIIAVVLHARSQRERNRLLRALLEIPAD